MLVVVLTMFLLTVKDQISSKHLVAAHFWGFVLSPNIILVYTGKRYILCKLLTIHISSIGFLQPFVHYFLPLAKFPPCLYHTQLLVPSSRVPFFFYLGRRTPIFILPPIILPSLIINSPQSMASLQSWRYSVGAPFWRSRPTTSDWSKPTMTSLPTFWFTPLSPRVHSLSLHVSGALKKRINIIILNPSTTELEATVSFHWLRTLGRWTLSVNYRRFLLIVPFAYTQPFSLSSSSFSFFCLLPNVCLRAI